MVSVHFYKATNLIGRLVGLFGRTDYVHCAVQVDGKHIIEVDAFNHASLHHLKRIPDQMIWVEAQESRVMQIYNGIMNTKYDYGATLEFLGLGKQNHQVFTCVELCQILLDLTPENITPDQFLQKLNKIHQECDHETILG